MNTAVHHEPVAEDFTPASCSGRELAGRSAVAAEKEMAGLCSESLLSSSLNIGFGLIARRIMLNSHASQTNWDSRACGLTKYKKSVFSVFMGCPVMVNTFIAIIWAV